MIRVDSLSCITLVHLYGDLLNLYGEDGNPAVIASALRADGNEVSVRRQSLGDELNLDGADLVYVGCGTEAKQLLAIEHLRRNSGNLRRYVDGGGLLLATGNAPDLFGRRIVGGDGSEVSAVGLFDYSAERVAHREVGEVLFHFGDSYLIGFQNRGSRIEFVQGSDAARQPLFSVEKGYDTAEAKEGFRIGGLIATSVLGLVTRNPAFTVWLALSVLGRRTGVGVREPSRPFRDEIERFGLGLDQVAFRAFLAHHHGIELSTDRLLEG